MFPRTYFPSGWFAPGWFPPASPAVPATGQPGYSLIAVEPSRALVSVAKKP